MIRSAAAGAAVLTAAAFLAAPAPARAADALPDLTLSLDRNPAGDPLGAIDPVGVMFGVTVRNQGEATATAVTVRIDLGQLHEHVDTRVPDELACSPESGWAVLCTIGDLAAGASTRIDLLRLTGNQRTPLGDAGSVTVGVTAAEEDANPDDNTTSLPVTVLPGDPTDLSLALDRDPAGDTLGAIGPDGVTYHLTVRNTSAVTASNVTVRLDMEQLSSQVDNLGPLELTCSPESGTVVLCSLGDLAPGQSLRAELVRLASNQDTPLGDAGAVTVSVVANQQDTTPDDNVVSFPVTVLPGATGR